MDSRGFRRPRLRLCYLLMHHDERQIECTLSNDLRDLLDHDARVFYNSSILEVTCRLART
jgi:hypothetical protein